MPDSVSGTQTSQQVSPPVSLAGEQESGYFGIALIGLIVVLAVIFLLRRWLFKGKLNGTCAGCSSGSCPISDFNGQSACGAADIRNREKRA